MERSNLRVRVKRLMMPTVILIFLSPRNLLIRCSGAPDSPASKLEASGDNTDVEAPSGLPKPITATPAGPHLRIRTDTFAIEARCLLQDSGSNYLAAPWCSSPVQDLLRPVRGDSHSRGLQWKRPGGQTCRYKLSPMLLRPPSRRVLPRLGVTFNQSRDPRYRTVFMCASLNSIYKTNCRLPNQLFMI